MSVDETRETPETVTPEKEPSESLSLAGQRAMQDSAPEETGEQEAQAQSGENIQEFGSSRDFGTFAHQAYEAAAEDGLDNEYVESEVPVQVIGPDGNVCQGRIDTLVDERHVFDYKTNDMRDWDPSTAYRAGLEHGKQVSGYVHSPDLPPDATGTVISTVPPNSSESRQAYADGLAQYGIGVQFSESEDPEDVTAAVREALKEYD